MQNAVPSSAVVRPSMNPKTICKIVVDSLMTVLLMAQMGRQLWSDVAHEWIAVGMFVLFITHHILNLNWYKAMFKGKYTPYRILQLIIDVLVFMPIIGLMVSGIMLSQHVLVSFPITGGTSFARILHMLATQWGFVLMALHLGFHWGVFISMARKAKDDQIITQSHNSPGHCRHCNRFVWALRLHKPRSAQLYAVAEPFRVP